MTPSTANLTLSPTGNPPRADQSVIAALGQFGPEFTAAVASGLLPAISEPDALRYVQQLAGSHYENFSVLSSLVPLAVRPDFAAVYAFCRWSDDLGDETGSDQAARDRSSQLLGWWRTELAECFAGTPRHPVFTALLPTIRRHALPFEPFSDLITAFEQDQTVTRYQTWSQLCDYCRNSANPVGRLVLYLAGHRPENDTVIATTQDGQPLTRFDCSDRVCTALQLTNFWQDARRDLTDRDRVYLPSDETGFTADDLRTWLSQGENAAVRLRYIQAVRPLVDRTREMFDSASMLPEHINPGFAPVVWLFAAGGRRVLERVEATGCTTLWQRPRIGKLSKVLLVGRAWIRARRAAPSTLQSPAASITATAVAPESAA